MSLNKSKFCYSNICLHFSKRAVPLKLHYCLHIHLHLGYAGTLQIVTSSMTILKQSETCDYASNNNSARIIIYSCKRFILPTPTLGQYHKTFLGIIYTTSSVFPYDFVWGYANKRRNYVKKSFITLATVTYDCLSLFKTETNKRT